MVLGLACSPCCLWFRIQPSPAQLSPAGIAPGSLVSRSVSLALLSPRPTQLPDILTQCFQSPLALKCVTYPAVNYLLTAHHPIGARQPSIASVTTGEAFSGQEEGWKESYKIHLSSPQVANGVAPRCLRQTTKLFLNFPHWGKLKRELMLLSSRFIGKQARQVTMQFAFPCSP